MPHNKTKLEDICVSLELAKALKENNYPQESLFTYSRMRRWHKDYFHLDFWNTEDVSKKLPISDYEFYAAPTASDIGEKLPEVADGGFLSITTKLRDGVWRSYGIRYINPKGQTVIEAVKESDLPTSTLANAMAKMWLYLKKEGLL